VDWLKTLDSWVTDNKAPGELTAKGGPNSAVQSQLLCPYPAVARKSGEAWSCSAKTR
jgi:hypothetical protein